MGAFGISKIRIKLEISTAILNSLPSQENDILNDSTEIVALMLSFA